VIIVIVGVERGSDREQKWIVYLLRKVVVVVSVLIDLRLITMPKGWRSTLRYIIVTKFELFAIQTD